MDISTLEGSTQVLNYWKIKVGLKTFPIPYLGALECTQY
jgi:hypothetical protein